jgi:membrane-associated phospholipid phosphatase
MLNHYRYTLLLLFISLQFGAFSQNFDINLLKSINKNETSFKDNFFKADARSVTVFNIAAPVGVFAAGLIKHDKKLEIDAAYMAGGFILSTIITQGTKKIVQRERPFEKYSFIVKRDEGGGYSFPSGHTSAAFTTATSLSLLFPKWYVIAPAYLWAASVGYARMYQGVHYPTDVLAGAVVGAGSAWLAWKVQKWMTKKHKKAK